MNAKPALLFIPTLLAGLALAGQPAELTIATAGKPVVEESFDAGLTPDWVKAKGSWEVKDGALVGSEVEADSHAAVLNLQTPNHDSVVQFDFALEGSKQFALSFNHAKGHLWRVTITESGAALVKDKNKKDPDSKAVTLAKAETALERGKRYTLTAEIVGSKVSVRIGNSIHLAGADPSFDTSKPNIRFVTSGKSVVIDNVKVWQAAPKG